MSTGERLKGAVEGTCNSVARQTVTFESVLLFFFSPCEIRVRSELGVSELVTVHCAITGLRMLTLDVCVGLKKNSYKQHLAEVSMFQFVTLQAQMSVYFYGIFVLNQQKAMGTNFKAKICKGLLAFLFYFI